MKNKTAGIYRFKFWPDKRFFDQRVQLFVRTENVVLNQPFQISTEISIPPLISADLGKTLLSGL